MEISKLLESMNDDISKSVEQYRSPKEQYEIDQGTAELEALLLELHKDEEDSVIWASMLIADEDKDDSQPVKPEKKRGRKPKAPAPAPAPVAFSAKSETRTIDPHGETAHLNDVLDAYGKRLEQNALKADKLEAELNSDIRTYDLSTLTVKAVIDWLDLEFTVNPIACRFTHNDKPFQDIRKFLKDEGINNNCHIDESQKDEGTFIIRLHDIERKNEIEKISSALARQYGADHNKMKIVAIELSTDWRGAKSNGLLTALHKSVRYDSATDNFRIYRRRSDKVEVMPSKPHCLIQRLNHGYNMGMGHRDDAPTRYHAYNKTTNNGKPLPQQDQHPRFEVTHKREALSKVDNSVDNLKGIITFGFSHIGFYFRPKQKLTSQYLDGIIKGIHHDKYLSIVKPYGQAVELHYNESRNKTIVPDDMETYSTLNQKVRNAVKNLARHF
ncbi:hypothetical protein ACINWCA157_0552 [Acinetobacter radioresistens WC-A-157]|uniref:hypothetical protein n=1 Tax=Acinetobacter radioresistens TaxID=40216 RepID=UPI000277C45A|nr:hypothetical protein [Acinetobacter radioresistens]EJO34984.1 hypothetical protein ACINWCA157_0552 [Acinetobacter radioresistens WC-A-157]